MSLANQREEMLQSLANFKADQLEIYKTNFSTLFPSETNLFESDTDKNNFLKSFLRNLRIFLECQMEQATKDGSDFYNKDAHELLRFTFWVARRSYIDPNNAFLIMEDIYDCLSMQEIPPFFEFLEELVSIYETFSVPQQQQAMMRIGNSILKKFSKVHDNDFRGRVQLFLSKITSVWEKTAVNLKSNINIANTTPYSSAIGDEDTMVSKQLKTKDFKELSNLRINFGAYMKFWELQKFLQNPNLLFSDDASIIFEDEDALAEPNEPEVMEIESMDTTAKNAETKGQKETKIAAFCKFATDIIEIFRKDPLLGSESLLRKKNYPKYLTKYSLMSIQLKDPSFRKSWLTQVIYCLWNIHNPLKLVQKKPYDIKEADMEKIKALEKKISEYIKEIPNADNDTASLNRQIQFFLEREKNWMQWKDGGCPSFEKPVPQDSKNYFKNAKDQSGLSSQILNFSTTATGSDIYPNYKEKEPYFKFISDTSGKFLKDTNFDMDNNVFNFMHKPQLPQQITALEPSVNYYFNSFLSEMKDPTLTDEDKMSSDVTTVWRAFRVLARNSMNQLTTQKTEVMEIKLDDILKKMSKNDPNAPEKAEGEGQEAKPADEKRKDDVKKDEVKEVKEPLSAELKEEKPEVKAEKEVKKDNKEVKEVKEVKEAKEVKEVKKVELKEHKTPEHKTIELKTGEHKEEHKVVERVKEPITLAKSESKPEKEKITERIKARGSEAEKPADKTIHLSGRKRSPETNLQEFEKQPQDSKKTKP